MNDGSTSSAGWVSISAAPLSLCARVGQRRNRFPPAPLTPTRGAKLSCSLLCCSCISQCQTRDLQPRDHPCTWIQMSSPISLENPAAPNSNSNELAVCFPTLLLPESFCSTLHQGGRKKNNFFPPELIPIHCNERNAMFWAIKAGKWNYFLHHSDGNEA